MFVRELGSLSVNSLLSSSIKFCLAGGATRLAPSLNFDRQGQNGCFWNSALRSGEHEISAWRLGVGAG